MRNTGALVGAILLVVGAALALTNVLVDAQAPQRLLAAVTARIEHPLLFLLALNAMLLIAGMLVITYLPPLSLFLPRLLGSH